MSITIVIAIDDRKEVEIDCALEAPSASSPSLSVSIGVVDAPDCLAVLVGPCAGGDVGVFAVVGLGVDCGGEGITLEGAFDLGCCNGELSVSIVEGPVPGVKPDCASKTTANPSVAVDGVPAIVTNCLAVARGLIVEPK
eukprot:2418262-Amphidinium_carterae.1